MFLGAVIFYALEYEHLEAFKLLLSYGADANAKKTADVVIDNNLLMVAFRKHARREGKGNLTKFIKIMLDGEYKLDGQKHAVEMNPYARGGVDGYRDVVSVIHKNGNNADSLALLYSHTDIDPKKFNHRRNYITRSAIQGDVDFLNLYLEFNAQRVNKRHASLALDYLKEKHKEDSHKTENLELETRLKEIITEI